MGEVLRVVGAYILRDAKLGAQEGGADLRDQLLCRALGLAEALREVAVEARSVAGPVNMLVSENRKIRLAARHGGGADEEILVGHVNGVRRWPVEGLLAAMHDAGAGRGKEVVCVE